MRTILAAGAAVLAVVALASAQPAAKPAHIIMPVPEMKWGPPPPVFETNASFALISGDPGKSGLYVVRLKMPAGYKIMPHWHPTDEHVTVVSGTFALGMGEKWDAAALKDLSVGGYALMPADMRHFAQAKTEATVQVHGMGPFALTYVNPADDPSKRPAK